MAGIYVLACLYIIFSNFSYIDDAFGLIFSQAFTPPAAVGGFIGVLIQGFRRGAFSNEAGAGSASIAHSAVITSYPASEGLVALLEPFIDTIVVCSVTALVILSSGVWTEKFDTTFSKTDTIVLNGVYSDEKNSENKYVYPEDVNELTKYVQKLDSNVNLDFD